MDFTDLLKIYGPMALGWVLYAFERKNNIEERKVNIALQDRVMAAFLEFPGQTGMKIGIIAEKENAHGQESHEWFFNVKVSTKYRGRCLDSR